MVVVTQESEEQGEDWAKHEEVVTLPIREIHRVQVDVMMWETELVVEQHIYLAIQIL